MTIDKAIEILRNVEQRADREGNGATYDAAKLGIEALKRLEAWRHGKVRNPDLLLPGETEG